MFCVTDNRGKQYNFAYQSLSFFALCAFIKQLDGELIRAGTSIITPQRPYTYYGIAVPNKIPKAGNCFTCIYIFFFTIIFIYILYVLYEKTFLFYQTFLLPSTQCTARAYLLWINKQPHDKVYATKMCVL